MKKFVITSILLALIATGTGLMAQDRQEEYLGLPGDNLNLYAVMKLFRESPTLESFEKNLNDQNTKINNLDLNGDNLVDYIRVIDNIDGDVHNIVLQVAINKRENQDVAVFTVQRDEYGKVYIQLTGDEALYGKNYIIEPILDDIAAGQTPNPGYAGNTSTIDGRNITVYRTSPVEIAAWPLIRYIYLPTYSGWHSSWYYGYYPPYWRPWHPFFWDYYYGYHYNWFNDYYAYYRHSDYHRYNHWNDYYYANRRAYSENVSRRIEAGNYRNTYSRPDQRREGEASFLRSYPDQNRRTISDPSVNSVARRSGSPSIQDRQSGDNGTARRSTNTVTNRSVSNPASERNVGTSRRSTTTITERSGSNPRSEQNMSTNRRSDNTVVNRSVSNPRSEQNISTNRRSDNRVANRSVSNTRSEPNMVSTRSSRQPAETGGKTSVRRSSVNSDSSASSKSGGRTKSSETSKSSHRR
jgi:hypothetical protein